MIRVLFAVLARRWVVASCMATAAGCGTDTTYGSFRMNTSDDKQVELRGSAHTHSSFESGNSYRVSLELGGLSRKFGEQSELAFVFPQKPDTGTWILATFGRSQRLSGRIAELSFDMGCAAPGWRSDSTVSGYWAFDSGTVQVAAPASRSGIAGSFRVFLHSQLCKSGFPDTAKATRDSLLLSGTFETKRAE